MTLDCRDYIINCILYTLSQETTLTLGFRKDIEPQSRGLPHQCMIEDHETRLR